MVVISFVESEVNKRSLDIENRFNKQLEVITQALDRNMTASMIIKTDYSLDEINDIFKYTWELIDEDNKKVEILVSEFPKLSKSMITNAYKKAKEIITENQQLKEEIEEDPEAVKLYNAIYGDDDFNPNAIKEAAEDLKFIKEVVKKRKILHEKLKKLGR